MHTLFGYLLRYPCVLLILCREAVIVVFYIKGTAASKTIEHYDYCLRTTEPSEVCAGNCKANSWAHLTAGEYHANLVIP